ncbi:hypothetical protein EDC19_1399 [Natranaerovirga hydrolytica]|uniref:DUF4085 family protein n=1 Tax=Natranaerovirga hydrolytica TaxID=680378 RepID=A0A4R1MK75_9FIRM|nr:hypothetical protein [Natranaerovirga hydrolytica]TCK93208.1 hypothetical protein EDC19_1399 [Natranaerovirga hydrolytica]
MIIKPKRYTTSKWKGNHKKQYAGDAFGNATFTLEIETNVINKLGTNISLGTNESEVYMKYYRKELWQLMHSSDEKKREKAKIEFRESAKKYGPYFEEIKDELPADFLKVFNENKWFHDFTISNIQILNDERKSTIYIDILNGDKEYRLRLDEVIKMSVDVPNKAFWLPSGMRWGYTEFELLNGGWRINILCDINCELEFVFTNIEVQDIAQLS